MMDSNNTPWYAGGLHFECLQCGGCCAGPDEGYIWVRKREIAFIAKYLDLPAERLWGKYIERIGKRATIIEKPVTKDCIFLTNTDGKWDCAIYPVRPNQCRTWPFWQDNLATADAWNRAGIKCAGINRGRLYCFEEIEKLRKQKRWWVDGD